MIILKEQDTAQSITFIPREMNATTIVLRNEKDVIISVLGLINHSIDEKNIFLESTFYDIGENICALKIV
jgi:hypothetical protein